MKRAGVVLALMFQAALLAAGSNDARVASDGGDQKPKSEPTPEQLLKSYDEKHPDFWPLPFTAMRIGTWNTMLQPWLPYQDAVVQTIASTKLDLLVLEEVWTDAARQAILSNPSVKAKYPYSQQLRHDLGRPLCVRPPADKLFLRYRSGPGSVSSRRASTRPRARHHQP